MIYSICRFKDDFFAVCAVNQFISSTQFISPSRFIQMLVKVLDRKLLSLITKSLNVSRIIHIHKLKSLVVQHTNTVHLASLPAVTWHRTMVFRRVTSAQPVQVIIIITFITKERGGRGPSF